MSRVHTSTRMQLSKLCSLRLLSPRVTVQRQCFGAIRAYASAVESDRFTITTPLYYANAGVIIRSSFQIKVAPTARPCAVCDSDSAACSCHSECARFELQRAMKSHCRASEACCLSWKYRFAVLLHAKQRSVSATTATEHRRSARAQVNLFCKLCHMIEAVSILAIAVFGPLCAILLH
jgi:hypothetical protein